MKREIRRWSEQEKALLFTRLTNEQIAKKTNKSAKNVGRVRRYYTGSYAAPNFYLAKHAASLDKEARIYDLARKLGVRIEGMR